jgi:putative ABC transport system substrate-binding protein
MLTRAREVASRLGLELVDHAIVTPGRLEEALGRLGPDDGLLVPDLGVVDVAAVLLEVSLLRRAPAMFSSPQWVSHGGLIAYGADARGQGIQAARLVAKILRGAHPRDLPVEGADHVVLAVNLKTAAALGLVAPRTLLYRADVIRR